MGDGNCLYRSLSVCLFGDPKWHIMIRLVIAHEMIINHNDYLSMTELHGVAVDYKNLITEVLVKGAWGSESHVVAAGNVFGVSLNLIVSHPNYEGIEEIQKKGSFPKNDQYYIMHTSTHIPESLTDTFGSHFVPMLRKNKMPTSPLYSDIVRIYM
jgi:hypothetical protein